MGRRISRQWPAVERDARPGEALHVGHVRIVIKIRVVLRLLLNDTEYAGRGLASFLATRHWRAQNPTGGVVERDPLLGQRNDRDYRLAGDTRLDGLDRAFHPSSSGRRLILRCDQRRQSASQSNARER